jgi:hypothetical protein
MVRVRVWVTLFRVTLFRFNHLPHDDLPWDEPKIGVGFFKGISESTEKMNKNSVI